MPEGNELDMVSIYEDLPPGDLRDILGWWDHSGADDTRKLVTAIMVLCNRVAQAEAKIEALQKAQTFEERMKADIAKLEAARRGIEEQMMIDMPTSMYNALSAQHNMLAIQIHEMKTILVKLGALPEAAMREE